MLKMQTLSLRLRRSLLSLTLLHQRPRVSNNDFHLGLGNNQIRQIEHSHAHRSVSIDSHIVSGPRAGPCFVKKKSASVSYTATKSASTWPITDFSRQSSVSSSSLSNDWRITEVAHDENQSLTVNWKNGSKDSFPFIYLRDNCQCPSCFEASAKQRIVDTALVVDFDIEATSIIAEENGVGVKWRDGHKSYFKSEWLWERKFPKTTEEQIKNSTCIKPKPTLWDGQMNGNLPEIEFDEVVETDEGLLKFLTSLSSLGIVVIKNAPVLQNQLYKITDKVGGHIRKTHYGEIFSVKTKDDPSNLSYTVHDIPLHADLAYYQYQPGCQFLHCIEQCKEENAAVSLIVDGFNIAARLKDENPEAFDILSTVKFTFRDIGKDEYGHFEKILERTIIGLDEFGEFNHIAHNNFTRSSFFNIPSPLVRKAYKAYYAWVAAINDKSNLVEYRMDPGDILAFNNTRLLHGRTKFDAKLSSRWLEGCYIDWDEIYSTLRCLRRKLGIVSNDKNAWPV